MWETFPFQISIEEGEREAMWQLHSKEKERSFFFFIALKYILYFPFCVVLKKITVLLMCLALSFKFRYFNLPLSFKFGFVLFSFSDWNQWLMLAFFGLHMQSRAGVPAS